MTGPNKGSQHGAVRTGADPRPLNPTALAAGAAIAVISGLVGGAVGGRLAGAVTSDSVTPDSGAVEALGYRAAAAAEAGRLLEAISFARLAAGALTPSGDGAHLLENLVRQRILTVETHEPHERANLAELARATGAAAGVVDDDDLKVRLIALECAVLEHAGAHEPPMPSVATAAAPSPTDGRGSGEPGAASPAAQDQAFALADTPSSKGALAPPVQQVDRGDPPLAFIDFAVQTTDRPELEGLLDGALAQLLVWPGEAEALIEKVTEEDLLARLDPVEQLDWLQRFTRTLDDVPVPSVRDLDDLARARTRAEGRVLAILEEEVAQTAALMLSLAQSLDDAPDPQAALALMSAAELFELGSPLFDLGPILEDPTFPATGAEADRGRAAAAELLRAIMVPANGRLYELEAQTTEILDSERQPREISPAAPGSLGKAAQVIGEIDRLGSLLVQLPLTDLPFIDPFQVLAQREDLQERLTVAFERAAETQQIRYETWALTQIFQAVEHPEWPEMLGQIEQGLLSPPTAALWNMTLSDRLGALPDPSERYLSASRQLRAVKVSRDRL